MSLKTILIITSYDRGFSVNIEIALLTTSTSTMCDSRHDIILKKKKRFLRKIRNKKHHSTRGIIKKMS